MKSYLGLVLEYAKVHKKKNRITIFCIGISVCLVTAIFGMADMGIRSEINSQIKLYGNYHIAIKDIDEEAAVQIGSRTDVAVSGWILQGGSGSLQDKALSIIGVGEELSSEMNVVLREGVYPEKADEALLNNLAMEQNNLTVGDTVTVTLPDGTPKSYKITGAFEDMSTLLKADAYGLTLSETGVREITEENFTVRYYIQFKSGINIRNAINEIESTYDLSDEQVGKNANLIGLLGYSDGSLMQSLYLVALILAALVLIAGTVMIAASFNTKALQRTQFFGMLRCLGASKKQVKRLVIVEGLHHSLKGVPLGLLVGQSIIWIACAFLKFVNTTYFSEIPLFQISGISLIAGTVIGFLTVILAALSPAKKASRVSPLTAVSGNAQLIKTSKAVHTGHLHVETGLGISHALSNKRNIVLMTCSFAISIVLFLTFVVMVTFLNQAMPALRPYAPDLSITSEDSNTSSLSTSLAGEIQQISGVKRVYGRMFAYDIPVTSEAGDGVITLISYEDHQFGWAQKELIEGKLDAIKNEKNSVMAVYSNRVSWNEGDSILLHPAAGDKEMTVGGVLATIPFNSEADSIGFLICSEETFMSLLGDHGYTIIDIQLESSANDDTVSQVRSLLSGQTTLSDIRLSNAESQDAYYTGAIFIYGFLIIIAIITVFNIFNSMNASVSTRAQQYGIMRSAGMSMKQLKRMIVSEALAYAVLGCIVGCILGLPLNRMVFERLITDKWGISWQMPIIPILLIVILSLTSVVLSIRRPIRQIRNMAIVDVIKT